MTERTEEPRPTMIHAHRAAEELLAQKVADGSLTESAALDMASVGFTVTTRILADLRRRDGLSERAITDAFQARLDKAEAAHDVRNAISAEFALAVWSGMQRDLAEWMKAAD